MALIFGALRPSVPLYGSGGFTSYGIDRLQEQFRRWAADGFTRVKMKIGREPSADAGRMSSHAAASLHVHVCCAAPRLVHVEYFHDHARIEDMLFDGAPRPAGGALAPDLSRPGMGMEFKRADAAPYAV